MTDLTRDFKETVKARMQTDADFRHGLLQDALTCFFVGDSETGRSLLRDYIVDDVNFEELARGTNIPAKSLSRMFSPTRGNPTTNNFFNVV